jgi:hypothetical protein
MIASIDRNKKSLGPKNTPSAPIEMEHMVKANQSKKMAEDEVQNLHNKPANIGTYNFKKIKFGDSNLSKNTENILKRFGVDGNNKYHTAVLSEDGKSLIVISGGKTTLSQLFGGSNVISRFFYKIFGGIGRLFGAPHKALAWKKYNDHYNSSHEKNPEGFKGEPIKHLISALAKDQYHGVNIFHKNEKTGDFDIQPNVIAITDAYYHLFDTFMPLDKVPDEEIKKYKTQYKKYYSIDKLITLSDSPKNLKELYHEIVEGLYQAQGFDCLTIPIHIHSNSNTNSNDLNYIQLPWHRILQANSGEWKIVGDKKIIDDNESIKSSMDEKTREEYKSSLIDQSTQITVIRPKSTANKPISNILAHCDAWSQMSSGSVIRAEKEEDRKLIKELKSVNSMLISDYYNKQKNSEESQKNQDETQSDSK